MVGQRFVSLLEHHPWFEIKWLAASERSAGKTYREACNWRLRDPLPKSAWDLPVHECKPGGAPQLLFSSLDSKVAGEVEKEFAQAGHVVVSNSSNFRMEQDVPLLIPDVNPDHLALVREQRKQRKWKGMIVTNPNCTTVGLVMSLAPLEKTFGLDKVLMTSMQAVSGAGYPGIPTLDILGNVVPFIGGEEEKVERETRKLLGKLCGWPREDGRIYRERSLQPRDGGRWPYGNHFRGAQDQSHDCRHRGGLARLSLPAAGARLAFRPKASHYCA